MINLEKVENKNIYSFAIEGKITEADVAGFYELLNKKAEEHTVLKVLGTITEFPHFKDFKAVGETVKMKLKALKSVGKYAILTDKKWLEILLPFGNFLTPGTPLKCFGLNERNKAIEWLEADENFDHNFKEVAAKRNLTQLPETNIYYFTIDSKVDEIQLSILYSYFKSFAADDKIKLLADIKNFDGIDHLYTLLNGIKTDLEALGNIEKYAVVADESLAADLTQLTSEIGPGLPLRSFNHRQKNEAIAWLKI